MRDQKIKEFSTSINRRVANLLRRERRIAKKSIEEVARQLQIDSEVVKAWECGQQSPPARVFYYMTRYYGPSAFHKAAKLTMELQFEQCRLFELI